MKIAIVSGYFIEGRGYQENIWAEELTKLGLRVCVFTSTFVPRGINHDFKIKSQRYEIKRFKGIRLPSGIIWAPKFKAPLIDFNPDWILWFGIGQFYGKPLLDDFKLKKVPLLGFFGENTGMHEFNWKKPNINLHQRIKAIGFQLLRKSLYLKAFQRCNKIICTKRQTSDILKSLCSRKQQINYLSEKMLDIPLGYSPDLFYPDFNKRLKVRSQLKLIPGDILVLASSRFSPGKKIGQLVDGATKAISQNNRLFFCLVGFFENNPTSKIINLKINTNPFKKQFIKHPFCSRKKLAELFNAADIGLYQSPSISVQEAMGTGLYMCLSNDGSMNHLLKNPSQGIFFDRQNIEAISNALLQAAKEVSSHARDYKDWRKAIARKNTWLSYERITLDLLKLMKLKIP
jgi:glycosyltransferase involved in cell wall biosynthesis